jgi:hypothetical protein
VTTSSSVFETEYEAHYRLITVREVDLYRWTATCRGQGCAYAHTAYGPEGACDAALEHCRERHVRGPWR